MKIIDKTPYQNEKGEFGFTQRVQAVLEYGTGWQGEVEAQKPVVAQLEKVLEKGFTLIRNLNLENSKIIEPLILIGPPGVFVLYVTPDSGFYEAKGEQWNVIRNDRRVPAPHNLMWRAARLARALQIYLNRQGLFLPSVVEPVLIAASPAMHIDQLRPIIRIVMSDAVKQFAATLLQARPVLQATTVTDVVDHIINPRPKPAPLQPEAQAAAAAIQAGVAAPSPATASEGTAATREQPAEAPERARAIFQAADEAKPFDPADLSFAFDANPEGAGSQAAGSSDANAIGSRRGAFSVGQWALLAILLLAECGVLAGFGYLILFGSR